jgi:hypothetical protein
MIESVKSAIAEMPNLFDLVEANDTDALWGGDLSVAADEGADDSGNFATEALCSDDSPDGAGLSAAAASHSVCADEIEPQQPRTLLSEVSVCADDPSQPRTSLSCLSVCADEPSDSLSDARLKTDIEQVGTTVYGLPLFRFRYKTGGERFEGVMAQDVLQVMPDAVAVGSDGFYRVNYGRLGIAMTRA